MGCPTCGCEKFFLKAAGDEYDVYPFRLEGGGVVFDAECDASAAEAGEESEAHCENCAWHGKLSELRRGG